MYHLILFMLIKESRHVSLCVFLSIEWVEVSPPCLLLQSEGLQEHDQNRQKSTTIFEVLDRPPLVSFDLECFVFPVLSYGLPTFSCPLYIRSQRRVSYNI